MCFSDNTNRSERKLKEDGTSVAPPQCLRSAQSTAPLILPVSTWKWVKNRAYKKKANEKSEFTSEIEKDEENDEDEDSIEDTNSVIHHANERGAGTLKAVPAIQYVLTPFFFFLFIVFAANICFVKTVMMMNVEQGWLLQKLQELSSMWFPPSPPFFSYYFPVLLTNWDV